MLRGFVGSNEARSHALEARVRASLLLFLEQPGYKSRCWWRANKAAVK